jgi:enoyl-CoA hydratase/carnithine racemase
MSSAASSLRFGLVSEVVDTGTSIKRAEELAAQIARLPANGVQGTKRAINRWLRANFESIFEHGLSLEFIRFPAAERKYGEGVLPTNTSA